MGRLRFGRYGKVRVERLSLDRSGRWGKVKRGMVKTGKEWQDR